MLRVSLSALLLASSAVASAQSVSETARRYDAISPTGVSYSTGSFTYKLPLLSVGQGEFPRQLTYGLSYNSGSAKYPNVAWVHNLSGRISKTLVDNPEDPEGNTAPQWQTWLYNVVTGQRSEGFEKPGFAPNNGEEYKPVTITGSSLVYTGGLTPEGNYVGYYTYTGSSGEIITYRSSDASDAPNHIGEWLEPDGTKVTFNYGTQRSIVNNHGLAILFEPPVAVSGGNYSHKICAINLTQYVLSSLTACPAGVPTTTIVGTSALAAGLGEVDSAAPPTGGSYRFTYSQSTRTVNGVTITRRAVGCVKDPGSTICSVENAYDTCDNWWGSNSEGAGDDPSWNGSRDRVIRQDFPTGEHISYAWYDQTSGCRLRTGVKVTDGLSASTDIAANGELGTIASVTDPLTRKSYFAYTGALRIHTDGETVIHTITEPEGNVTQFAYDARGNIIETRKIAKPGGSTVVADIVTSAVYPGTCTNRVKCNKPTSTKDANGYITSYTYDDVHGGVLTETAPPVNGVYRVKRYEYVQRYARILNSSGDYVAAGGPVWLLYRERTCISTATLDTGCAGGSADEVVTTYEYGPTTGAPNNLWLRGIAVTADGATLRTCYGYDSLGRRISETKPAGTSGSCS